VELVGAVPVGAGNNLAAVCTDAKPSGASGVGGAEVYVGAGVSDAAGSSDSVSTSTAEHPKKLINNLTGT
jgi:hypothetical protein